MANRSKKTSPGWAIRSGFVGLVGIIALLVLGLVNEYQEADKHAQLETENISRVLEEHALATVQKIDLLLRDVQGHIRPDDMHLARGASSPRAKELHALLKSRLETLPEGSVLYLTNAKGDHVFGSIDPVPRINIADRYHFTRQRDDPAAGLVISPPLVSRTTGKWTMTLTRRLNFEDGSFAGVVDLVMNPEYFQNFYRTINLGSHGLISLYDKELHLAARHPPREKDMGKVANIYVKPDIDKGVKHGVYHAKSPLDGIKRLVSFRQVGDLPLVIFAGIAEEDYLAEWRQHVWQYSIGLMILGLMVISLELRQRRAERALRKSDEDLHTIADYTYDWEYWEGPQRELRYMSPSCERITGYSLAEFKADPELLYSIIHPDDRPLMADHRNNIAHQDMANIDFRIIRHDGEIRWISHGCQAVYGKGGEHQGRRANNRDITERKAIEQTLQESEERFRLIGAAANDGIIILGAEDRVIYWSPAAEKIFGYPANEVFNQKMHELVAPARFREAFRRGFEHFMAFGQGSLIGKTLEIEALHKDGKEFPVELSISALQIKGQWHALGIVRDISERKQAEAKLVESESRLRTILMNEPECIKIVDAQGCLIQMNPAGLEMIEADSLEQVAGRSVLDVIAPEYHKAFTELHKKVLAGEVMQMEFEVLGLKGGRRWLETHAVPMQDKGETVHLAVTRDISERKRSEDALKALNETLDQRVKEEVAKNMDQERLLIQQSRLAAMGEMIGNIAHQWRQPINALTLLLGNIKDAYEYHELDKEYLDREVDKGQQMIQKMSSTIDDFRNFFKPNKEKQDFLASDGVEESIKMVAQSFKIHNVDIVFERADEPRKVMGYPNEFAQVVLNALSNAKEAIVGKKMAGEIHIAVESGETAATVAIRDNGDGIPEEIIGKVFDPYFTTKEKGTGIGLYMSKMIMEHMGGEIAIRNVEGGAEVLITLQLADDAV